MKEYQEEAADFACADQEEWKAVANITLVFHFYILIGDVSVLQTECINDLGVTPNTKL
jgi:hypothetical protein